VLADVRAARDLRRPRRGDLPRPPRRLYCSAPSNRPWDEVGLTDALDDPAAITAVEWPESWRWPGGPGCRVLRVRLAHAGEGRTAEVDWPPA
jgi:tRNA A37 threonylcarbamoyladenosine biosynthesis protein TsaE